MISSKRGLSPIALYAAILLFGLVSACDNRMELQSDSMAPTILSGEKMELDTAAYLSGQPERWDVVVFEHPRTDALDVKRVVGLPGETVFFTPEGLIVNGVGLRQPARIQELGFTSEVNGKPSPMSRPLEIPENMYFLLGDDPDASLDSRFYGAVPGDRILWRVKDK